MIPSYEPVPAAALILGLSPVPDFWNVIVAVGVPVDVIVRLAAVSTYPAATLKIMLPMDCIMIRGIVTQWMPQQTGGVLQQTRHPRFLGWLTMRLGLRPEPPVYHGQLFTRPAKTVLPLSR